jgi:hypothetical protein
MLISPKEGGCFMRRKRTRLLLAVGALLLSAPASYGSFVTSFDLAPVSNPTTSQVLPTNPFTFSDTTTTGTGKFGITATGLGGQLYYKYSTGDSGETGLGLTNDPDHEINTKSSISLDFSHFSDQNLFAAKINSIQFTISSVQKGEGFEIFGVNGTTQTLLDNFVNNNNASTSVFSYTASGANAQYGSYSITAIGQDGDINVLLNSVVVNYDTPPGGPPDTAPEPATMTLLASGGFAMLLGRYRAWKKRRSGGKIAQ